MGPRAPRRFVLAVLAAVLIAAAPLLAQADVTPPGDSRDRLTFDELMVDGPNLDGPIHNDYFMPVGPTEPAHHDLEGVLEIAPSSAFAGSNRFPDFSAAFFTVDGYLVPVERDFIRSPSPAWDIILSPGRVWSEPGDNGWSRASFPFVLVGGFYADSHNGLATFLYDEREVSDLQIQVVRGGRTPVGLPGFDAWLRIPAAYQPGHLDAKNVLATSFKDELARRLPTEPLEALVSDTSLIDVMEHGLDDAIVTGFLDDGVLYRSPCYTHFGDYPYCDELRHEIYSATKSAASALTLLWLAEKYGARVLNLKIVDYVDVTADHDGWNDVTFRDAVNMATGIGDMAPEPIASEGDFWRDARHNLAPFRGAATAQEKLDIAFKAGSYEWGPGEVMRYNNLNLFVLAAAMDAYLKSEEGPGANLWDRVSDDVLRPIGIAHAPMAHTREPDGGRGIPIMAWGFLPTIDDMAKIARLYQDRGVHDGQQLLYGEEIDMLLQGDPERGLPIHHWTNEFGRVSYDVSLWYTPMGTEEGCTAHVPFMWGSGGNFVVLMPNGMTGIRLGVDSARGKQQAENLAAVGDSLRSFCRS